MSLLGSVGRPLLPPPDTKVDIKSSLARAQPQEEGRLIRLYGER